MLLQRIGKIYNSAVVIIYICTTYKSHAGHMLLRFFVFFFIFNFEYLVYRHYLKECFLKNCFCCGERDHDASRSQSIYILTHEYSVLKHYWIRLVCKLCISMKYTMKITLVVTMTYFIKYCLLIQNGFHHSIPLLIATDRATKCKLYNMK